MRRVDCRTNALPTDWPTNQPTDQPMDMTSYRSAGKHLKRIIEGVKKVISVQNCMENLFFGGSEERTQTLAEKDWSVNAVPRYHCTEQKKRILLNLNIFQSNFLAIWALSGAARGLYLPLTPVPQLLSR